MRTDPVLSVRGLKTYFRLRAGNELRAVDDVDFALERGRTLCIVGESGSGKSVTARSILQLVAPPGRIVGGQVTYRRAADAPPLELTSMHPRGRAIRAIRGREIAMVFQEPMTSLSPIHRIGWQIAEAMLAHGMCGRAEAMRRAVRLLGQVEIPDPTRAAQRYPFEFSGGMRQRAMIAMALACEPRVLIADEPTTALDVTTQAEILRLIKRLQDENGLAVLFITHDMGVVAQIADDVLVMLRGRVVEHAPVQELFARPHDPYTQRLLEASKKLGMAAPPARAAVPPSKPLLHVENVSLTYPAPPSLFRRNEPKLALKDVSFSMGQADNLGIVGESGSGKTTLGSCLLRILQPDSGAIRYTMRDGREVDLAALDRGELRSVHREMRMVFQDPFASLNPRMTVEQAIGEPLRMHGLADGAALRARVADLLRKVGLPEDAARRYPHAFSGGQRQRIVIARALALDPRLIVADEATAALDVTLRGQILDLLLELQQRLGLSYLFIAHDISVVRYFCHRVAVMHRGRIVEIGEAARICSTPTEPYARSLISAVPNPDPRAKRMLHRHRFAETV